MTVACFIVAFALGVGIGGIVLAAGVALYVLGLGGNDEIKDWRAK
jgi:small-conductance mechanosensitive channel